MILLGEMNSTIARYADNPNLMDMAQFQIPIAVAPDKGGTDGTL